MPASQYARALVFAATLVSLAGALEASCLSTGCPTEGSGLLQFSKSTPALKAALMAGEESRRNSVVVVDCTFEHSGPELLEASSFKYGDCVTENGTTYYMLAGEAVNEIMPGEVADLELEEDQERKLDDGSNIYRVLIAMYHDPGPDHITATDEQQGLQQDASTGLFQGEAKQYEAEDDPEYILHNHSHQGTRGCPTGYRRPTMNECMFSSHAFNLTFQRGGHFCGTPPGCIMGTFCGRTGLFFNQKMTWKRTTEICKKEGWEAVDPYQASIQSEEDICPSHQYTDKVLCDDGSAVADGECCADTGHCPSSCETRQTMFVNGQVKCSCTGCTMQRRSETSDADAFLKAHNYLRCLHGHERLSWHGGMAENAQRAAQQSCDGGSDWWSPCYIPCHPRRPNSSYDQTPRSGENLGRGQTSPEQVVTAWYNELFKYKNGPGQFGEYHGWRRFEAGHFSAMLWKSTKKLGCGWCGDPGISKVWACHYADTPPNRRGAFVENVPQTWRLSATRESCCAQVYGPPPPPTPAPPPPTPVPTPPPPAPTPAPPPTPPQPTPPSAEHHLLDACSGRCGTYSVYGSPRLELDSARTGEAICCDANGRAQRKISNRCTGQTSRNGGSMKTYDQALAICEEAGMSLCSTQAQLNTGCRRGCMHDCALAWIQ